MNQKKTHRKFNCTSLVTWKPALQRQYAFTLRRTMLRKGVTEGDYLNHFLRWEDVKLIDHVFEMTAGLHMHGIIEIPEKLLYGNCKKLRIRGWSLVIKEMFNEFCWRSYYMKDQHNRDYEEEENNMSEDYIDEDPLLTKPLFVNRK